MQYGLKRESIERVLKGIHKVSDRIKKLKVGIEDKISPLSRNHIERET
jgi:hypothetical protein